MATSGSDRTNQAKAIREMLASIGLEAPPRTVIQRLAAEGVEGVTPQQVSNEKAKLRRKGETTREGVLTLANLRKVKALVDDLGSIEAVKLALNELEELQKKPDKAENQPE